MKKTILAATLILGTALTAAASDQGNKPSTGPATTGGGLNPNLLQTNFKLLVNQDVIFVMNLGPKDWTGALDVTATCTPVAPSVSCGSNFPFKKHYAAHGFPKGVSQGAPVSAPQGNSVIVPQNAGYDALFMGLPVGTFKIVAKAGTNTSGETTVTIASVPGAPLTIQRNPATLGIVPKTP